MGRRRDRSGHSHASKYQIAPRNHLELDVADLGELALWAALLMAVWAAVMSFAGVRAGRSELMSSGRRGAHAALAFLLIAATGLLSSLWSRDFSVAHVAAFSAAGLPAPYAVLALWAGGGGALLVLALLVALIVNFAFAVRAGGHLPANAVATSLLSALLAILIAVTAIGDNPLERLPWLPSDGRGLAPALQTPAFALHPLILYIGLSLSSVPLASAVSAWFNGNSERIALPAGTWAAWACALTGVGILAGMWWEFSAHGWRSTWITHPLLDTTLIAWLAIFVMAVDARRMGGAAERSRLHLTLAAIAFVLSAVAALVVRGRLDHSAARPGDATVVLLVIACLLGAALALFVTRRNHEFVLVRPGPWLRRPGVVMVAGAALLAAGAVGALARKDYDIRVATGGGIAVSDGFGRRLRFVSEGISRYDVGSRQVLAVAMSVYSGSGRVGLITSEIRQYVDGRGSPMFEPYVASGLLISPSQATHLALLGASDAVARVRISFQPLVWLVWLGGLIFVTGAVSLVLPRRIP